MTSGAIQNGVPMTVLRFAIVSYNERRVYKRNNFTLNSDKTAIIFREIRGVFKNFRP